MSVVGTTKMTARQFLMLGDDPPGVRLELVDGEIVVSPSPRPDHSYVDRMLTHILLSHILPRKLGVLIGDVDTIFGEYDVRRPDLIYFTKEREHLVKPHEALDGPPDLCIEIIGPSSGRTDRKKKFKLYAESGVRIYWIADPAKRTIEGYRLVGSKYHLEAKGTGNDVVTLPPFSELKIKLGQLWLPEQHA
jgi:Uma2 family endonuclease